MTTLIGLLILGLLLAIPLACIGVIFILARILWCDAGPERPILRTLVVLGALLILGSPYLALKAHELNAVYSRVPEPLRTATIEYRLEKSWGIGMPGDAETGFVVYRLTNESADWARAKGSRLGAALDDPKTNYEEWMQTPVDTDVAHPRWIDKDAPVALRTMQPTVGALLDSFGYSIPVDAEYRAQMDRAIQNPGSVYRYGRGGTVTVVDPAQGKVFFAYAG